MKKLLFYKSLSIAKTELQLRHGLYGLTPEVQERLSTLWGDKACQFSILSLGARTGLTGLFMSSLSQIASPLDYETLVLRLFDKFTRLRFLALTDMLLKSELEKISSSFLKKNCEMIVLKGPILAEEIYCGADCRNHLDLDLLVNPATLEQASNILSECGYVKLTNAEEENVNQFHHVSFMKQLPSGISTIVELHFRLRSKRYGGVSMEWTDIEPLTENIAIPFPHRRLRKESLLCHALLEAFEDGGSFRHFIDVVAMEVSFEDDSLNENQTVERWQLKRAAEYYGKTTTLIISCFNELSSNSTELPSSGAELSSNAVESSLHWKGFVPPWWLFDPDNSLSLRLLYGHYIAGGFWMTLKHLIFWGFFPPPAVLARRTGLNRNSRFFPLVYLLSPFIILDSFLRKKKNH
jgi:hypothetical protein